MKNEKWNCEDCVYSPYIFTGESVCDFGKKESDGKYPPCSVVGKYLNKVTTLLSHEFNTRFFDNDHDVSDAEVCAVVEIVKTWFHCECVIEQFVLPADYAAVVNEIDVIAAVMRKNWQREDER